jgi:hypothetical protein
VTLAGAAWGLACAGLLWGCNRPLREDPPDAGVPPAEQRCEGFQQVGAEEAVDLSTGLRWDTYAELTLLTHEEAAARCEARGKRLPTRQELVALRRPAPDGCALPACPFRGDRCATIQCGSKIPGTSDHWGVAFSGGGLVGIPAGQPEVVLCVAGP